MSKLRNRARAASHANLVALPVASFLTRQILKRCEIDRRSSQLALIDGSFFGVDDVHCSHLEVSYTSPKQHLIVYISWYSYSSLFLVCELSTREASYTET
jgi:hypothetical protein